MDQPKIAKPQASVSCCSECLPYTYIFTHTPSCFKSCRTDLSRTSVWTPTLCKELVKQSMLSSVAVIVESTRPYAFLVPHDQDKTQLPFEVALRSRVFFSSRFTGINSGGHCHSGN